MSYGIEIFNSLGELVFSSDRRTVQILKVGTYSLTSMFEDQSLGFGPSYTWIEFDPVDERPQVYAQLAGRENIWAENEHYYAGVGIGWKYRAYYWQMTPYIGVFEKNHTGKYYRVRFGAINSFLWETQSGRSTPGNNIGQPMVDLPYVIFR